MNLYSMTKSNKMKSKNVWQKKSPSEGILLHGMDIQLLGKLSMKQLLKSICVIFCSLCFTYQITQLIRAYFSGKTLVEIRIEELEYSRLPALTICLPTFMDMDKFADQYMKISDNQDHQKLYKEYLDYKQMNRTPWNAEVGKKQNHFFWHFLWKAFTEDMEKIPIIDMFEKYSINPITKYSFKSLAFNETDDRVLLPEPKQLDSVVPFLDPRKCITLFSDIDQNFRDKKFNLIQMRIKYEHPMEAFPYIQYYQNDLYVSFHSSNILPDYKRSNVFNKIEMGMVNFVTYSEVQTRLLPAPYLTKCLTYQLSNSGEQNVRSDCIQKCLYERLRTQFNLNCFWTYNNMKLIRGDNLLNLSRSPFCNHKKEPRIWKINDEQFLFEKLCEKSCPRNCIESFYNYEIETRKRDNESGIAFSISLEHGRFPDQVIEHRPIMDFITVVSNLGGLLGMWLGFSVLFLCNRTLDNIYK